MENGLNVIVRSPTHNRAIIHVDINKIVFISVIFFYYTLSLILMNN
nr:MAG TPA: hypothetical protein [Caudoviricetes sp.]